MTPSFRILVTIGLLATLPLAACTGVAESPPDAPPVATVTSDESTDAAELAALTPADQAQPDVARPTVMPLGQFRGLSDEQVIKMLGPPQFLRSDASAQLWQYRGEGCVLHLFLYRSNEGLRVRHAEVGPRVMPGVMNGAAADACLTKLTAAPPAATS